MARLRRVTRAALTLRRVKRGRGHSICDPEGRPLADKELRARVAALGIPPAWTDVCIAEHPRAHIQACGYDAAGRLQYIYHEEWEQRRAARKQQQLALLADTLPRIRRRVREDLTAETGSRRLALAIGLALIDRTAMRVGRERYLETNGTRGAGTLFTRDVAVKGQKVVIRFPAKSGKRADYLLEDAALAAAIVRIKTIPGHRLLMYRDADGVARALRTEEINTYLRELAGAPVTAKDFRTLHASALAADALARLEPAPSDTARRRQMAAVTRQIAAFLQNTPAVCRSSYIAPCLFRMFEAGRLSSLWLSAGSGGGGLRQREFRLGALLAQL